MRGFIYTSRHQINSCLSHLIYTHVSIYDLCPSFYTCFLPFSCLITFTYTPSKYSTIFFSSPFHHYISHFVGPIATLPFSLHIYIYIHAYIYRFIFKHSNTPSLRLPSRHNITSIVHSIITIDNSLLICVVILSSMISSTCKQTQTEILTHSHYLIEIALWSWHRFAEHFPFDWNIQITCSSLIQWTSSYLYIWSFEKKHDSGRCIR